jgi:hypothetical protein
MDPQLAWETCPYPHGTGHDATHDTAHATTLAHRLDFARFYQGAVTDLVRAQLEEAREVFAGLPRELKLGHCSETLELGTDWHALVGVAAATDTTVRFTGAGMGEIFTRRLASLCRGHGVPFATEAPREVDGRHLVERLYTDLAAGTTSFFEFPEQMEAVREPLAALRPALGRAPVLPAVAIAYPTTELRLAPGQGAPTDTVHCFDAFRRVCDLHPLDERQIARGALREHAALVWLEDGHVPAETLAALDGWVRAGGVLITGCARGPLPLPGDEGEAAACAELLAAMRPAAVFYGLRATARASIVHPGDTTARLLLGGDWHGRDDGAFAWPALERTHDGAAPPLPCRWTGGRATVHLPRPAGGDAAALDFVLDAWAPPDGAASAVRVSMDGAPAGSLALRGASEARLTMPTPATVDGIARIAVELPAQRPPGSGRHADRRELGLLVRRMALVARGAALAEAHATGTPTALALPDVRARGEQRPLGVGRLLTGDGTPLSALALLRSWIDELPPEQFAAGRLARDASLSCIVSALAGGLLVHNPDPCGAASPMLAGHPAVPMPSDVPDPIAPLGSRWMS